MNVTDGKLQLVIMDSKQLTSSGATKVSEGAGKFLQLSEDWIKEVIRRVPEGKFGDYTKEQLLNNHHFLQYILILKKIYFLPLHFLSKEDLFHHFF